MTDQIPAPAGTAGSAPAATYPAAAYTPAPGSAYPDAPPLPPAARRRRLRPAALTAIIAGTVLVVALSFGGGIATGWALGSSGGPGSSFTGGGPGEPPQMGGGGPQSDQTWPGPRDEEGDGTSNGTDDGSGT